MLFIYEKEGRKKDLIRLIWSSFTVIILHCCILNKVFGCVLSKNMPATETGGKQDGNIKHRESLGPFVVVVRLYLSNYSGSLN